MASSNSPCAACKFLRRKCTQGCVFAPYFPPDQPQKFANVHRVFGASNVAKLLNELSPVQREDAVNSLAYEADARLRDPVYGCVGYISILQHKLKQVQMDLFAAKKELANYIGPAAHGPFLPHHHPSAFAPPPLHPHFPSPSSAPPFGVPGAMGMGLGLSAAASPQMLLREQQQQQQLVEAQQQLAAVAAAREQELLRYEQQHELARLSGGFDGRGFNPMGGGGAVVVAAGLGAASGLALVPSQQFHDNNNSNNLPFPLQHQQQQQQQQQHQHQHQLQLQFPDHHQPQPQHHHHHHRDGSDEGRSGIGPSS